MVTSSQIKAARALLKWSARELAEVAQVSLVTLKRYEAADGIPEARLEQFARIKQALVAAGIEFIGTPDDAPGIRIHGSGSKE